MSKNNNIINKRNELLPTLSRTSPVLFFLIVVLNCILYPSYESFYLFIVYCIVNCSNFILKDYVMKPIYKLFNVKSLPLLGIGERPQDATSCGCIIDNSIATSFGMPSGHSQLTWTVCSYLLLKIINNWYKNSNKNNNNNNKNNKNKSIISSIWIIVSCIILLITSFYISYSRVYIEGCHTIQQVTFGGLIGIISGFLIYYFENDIIHVLSKMY